MEEVKIIDEKGPGLRTWEHFVADTSQHSPWYSQCVPNNATNANGGSSLVPDSPIITNTIQTVITIGNGPTQTIVTTMITYLTPGPVTTPPPSRPITVSYGGTYYTIQPDAPYTPPPQKREAAPAASPAVAQYAMTAGAATPTILAKGQYWIRAVEAPNFHKYLQTAPQNSVGTAMLGSSKSAGQYNIVSGQVTTLNGEEPLYLHVEKPTDFTQRTLATWFNATKNEFGTFAFQGDALTWSAPEVKRQNLAAWLVCKGSSLFINTGAYNYQTPAGCADETVSRGL